MEPANEYRFLLGRLFNLLHNEGKNSETIAILNRLGELWHSMAEEERMSIWSPR